MAITTTTSSRAWAPDLVAFRPDHVIPEALVLQCTDVAGVVEGDDPLLRVPYMVDAPAQVVLEDQEIPESNPERAETLVATSKVAQLLHSSREQLVQPNADERFARSASRAVIQAMDALFIQRPAPTPPTGATGDDMFRNMGPTGILSRKDIVNGGAIGTNLDAMFDALAIIEGEGGTATHILCSPQSWASLNKIKSAAESAMNLLGTGTQAGPRMVLSTPVLISSAVPLNSVVVLDKNAIVSAVGDVKVARSEHSSFRRDAVDIRVTFRAGWNLMNPRRVVALTI